MTITDRDKRALIALAVAAVIALAVFLWPDDTAVPEVVGTTDSANGAEERLERVRTLASQVPGRQEELKRLRAELKQWEEGLIQSDTGQQAQAEVLQILRAVGSSQTPAVEFGSVEIGQIRALEGSEDYGEALVSVSFDCAIEQLVNLLADITGRPEAIVTDEIRISPRARKEHEEKLLRVRLRVACLVPRALVPEQRGFGQF